MKPRALERARDGSRSAALRLDVSTTSGAAGSEASTSASSDSGRVRQQHVEQDDVGPERPHRRERRGAVARLVDDREACRLEQPPREAPEARVIVDNKHRGSHPRIVAQRHEPRHSRIPVILSRLQGSP